MTQSERKQLFKGLAFLAPWIVGLFAFTALPIVLSLYYSFCDYSLLQKPAWVGLDNYRALMGDSDFWKSLRNTFYYAAMAIPGGMMVSLGLALLLNTRIRAQAIYRTIIFLPSLVPAVASAMLWLWIYNSKLGLLNALLGAVGIQGPGWLTEPNWAMPALAFMSIWAVGQTVVIYLAGLQDVPIELYEAAEIDGASGWRRLVHVTIPMISPVIFFNLVMALIGTFQRFTEPQIIAPGGQPARSTYFYVMYLYDNAFIYLKMGTASAMAWILLVIVVCLTGLAFWTSRRWVHYQGN
jgi:multiple sugar transport system permease protein